MKHFLLLFLINIPCVSGLAQSVSGKVYNSSGREEIAGVNVISKLTGKASITDSNGKFYLEGVLQNDTLMFSFVGFSSLKVPLWGRALSGIDIFLQENSTELEQVIVNSGYQSFSKGSSTGSYSHLSNEIINRNPSPNLISRLEGITSSLHFEIPYGRESSSGEPKLRLRGLSTLAGESAPLLIVDNFPFEGDIRSINPNDIKDVTVLKDASASSIWGARAGNGVIVVTTKAGGISREPIIQYTSNFSIGERPDLLYSPVFLPSADLIDLEVDLYRRGMYPKNDWTANTPVIEILFALDDGKISPSEAEISLKQFKNYDIRTEAMRTLYRRSYSTQHNLNLSGGTEKHKYFISAGRDNARYTIQGNSSERTTLSVKNDVQILDNLTLNSIITFADNANVNNGIGLTDLNPSGMSYIYTYARLRNEKENLAIVRNNRSTFTERASESGLLDWQYRPLDEVNYSKNSVNTKELRVNTSLVYNLFKKVNFELKYQYHNQLNSTANYYDENSYFARNLINQYTQADGRRPIPIGGILNRSSGNSNSHYGRAQINFNENFGKDHRVDFIAGSEIRQNARQTGLSYRLYGYNEERLTHFSNMNFENSFSILPRGAARIPNGNSPGRSYLDRFISYYSNVNYSLLHKYGISASARWDASNLFGVDFNQKGVPLWSVGSYWRVSDEPFFKVNWIDLLKIRATYGISGNIVSSLSALPYIEYGSNNSITGLPRARLRSTGNPDLSWESVSIINAGVDFQLFNSRVTGAIEWYIKKGTNLIGEDLFDPTTGIIWNGNFYNMDNMRNYANINTNGLDIEITSLNINKGFKWSTTLLASKTSNIITKYNAVGNPVITSFLGSTGIPLIQGASKDQLYVIPWHGLNGSGDPMVKNGELLGIDYVSYFNNLRYNDLIKGGLSEPPYFGSLRNTISWKRFSLGVLMMYKFGHKFKRSSVSYSNLMGAAFLTHQDYLGRWQSAGDENFTSIPSMPSTTNLRRDQAYLFSEVLLEDAGNIRLQDVNISYHLPLRVSEKRRASSVIVNAYVNNLGVVWSRTKHNIDPDVRSLYPAPCTVTLGATIKL